MRTVLVALVALVPSVSIAQTCAKLDDQSRMVLQQAEKSPDGVAQFSWVEIDSSDLNHSIAKPVQILMSAQAKSRLLDQLSISGYIAGVPFRITQSGRDALKLPSCN